MVISIKGTAVVPEAAAVSFMINSVVGRGMVAQSSCVHG